MLSTHPVWIIDKMTDMSLCVKQSVAGECIAYWTVCRGFAAIIIRNLFVTRIFICLKLLIWITKGCDQSPSDTRISSRNVRDFDTLHIIQFYIQLWFRSMYLNIRNINWGSLKRTRLWFKNGSINIIRNLLNYTCEYIWMFVCVCVSVFLNECLCLYACIHINKHTNAHKHIYMCVCACIFM